jgi:hypothetical protein
MHADIVDIPKDIVIPKSENGPAIRFETAGANLIINLIVIICMLRTVDFDNKFLGGAGKINDVSGDRQLAAEAEAHETMRAQLIPKA